MEGSEPITCVEIMHNGDRYWITIAEMKTLPLNSYFVITERRKRNGGT
jgi:hypothetical protein